MNSHESRAPENADDRKVSQAVSVSVAGLSALLSLFAFVFGSVAAALPFLSGSDDTYTASWYWLFLPRTVSCSWYSGRNGYRP
jgi:hypothetical protein